MTIEIFDDHKIFVLFALYKCHESSLSLFDFTKCIEPRSYPRRMAPAERKVVRRQVAEMFEAGVIEPSRCPLSSPVV